MDRTLRTYLFLIGLPAAATLSGAGLGCEATTQQRTGCMGDLDCGTGRICDDTGRCIAEPKKIKISISKVGDGEGTVTSSPTGLDCGSACEGSFYIGKQVTLTATPASGSSVVGFSIGCSSTSATCQLTPSAEEDVQVLVNFGKGGPVAAPPLCTPSGVCWENPRPQGNRLNDVHIPQAGADVWAVGEGGTVVRRTSTDFVLAPTGGTQNLRGVGGTSANLFVVGDGGAVLRWGGTSWQSESSGTFADLYDVWANDTTAIAVGTNSTIIRRTGSSWSTQMSTGRTLRGVVMIPSTGEAYAVGDMATALRWTGTAWVSVSSAILNNHDLRSVTTTDGGYPIFAASSSSEIYRLASSGGSWEQVYTSNLIAFNGISASSALGTFAVGREVGGTILRSSNGTTWTRDVFNFEAELLSVSATSTEAWAVGDAGAMLRKDTNPWAPQSSGRTTALRGLSSADTKTAWATGANGAILRYSSDTRAWAPVTLPGSPLMYSIAAVSANEAYAVGAGGAVFKWNGVSWGALNSGTGSDLYAVCSGGAGTAVAVGQNGIALRINGTTVTSGSGGTASSLRGVWCVGASDTFAVGDNGVVVRDSGTGFAAFAQPGTASSIGGIWGTSAGNFWLAAGADLYQYSGGYTKHSPGVTGMRAIWGGRADDVYAVGDKGAVLRWSGASWTRVDSGTPRDLYGVGGNSQYVWFAGDGGAILSRSR